METETFCVRGGVQVSETDTGGEFGTSVFVRHGVPVSDTGGTESSFIHSGIRGPVVDSSSYVGRDVRASDVGTWSRLSYWVSVDVFDPVEPGVSFYA